MALLRLRTLCFLRSKILLNLRLAFVLCPAGRCTVPKDILYIQSCAALDEKSDHFLVACAGSLVQRRRMRMAADWIVAIWIFARVQQQPNDLNMAKLRRQGERQMAVVSAGVWKEPTEVVDAPQRGCDGKVDPGAAPEQSVYCFQLAVQRRCVDCAVGVCFVIAKQID